MSLIMRDLPLPRSVIAGSVIAETSIEERKESGILSSILVSEESEALMVPNTSTCRAVRRPISRVAESSDAFTVMSGVAAITPAVAVKMAAAASERSFERVGVIDIFLIYGRIKGRGGERGRE